MEDLEIIFVSFSGGRTSAYMCKHLKDKYAHKYRFIFVFANTGLEHEKTLEFVDRCDRELNLSLIWIEAVTHHGKRKGCTHKIVDYQTASRNGEPFRAVIERYGIPNAAYNHCNRELKLNPILSLKRSLGFRSNHKTAVGIRADEIDRMSMEGMKKYGVIYPLISWIPTTKPEIRHFWKEQAFDLEIPEHLGNCVTCWKKSDRKLYTIAKHEPQRFEFFAEMESLHAFAGAGDGRRVFFRRNRSSSDIIASSKQPFVEFKDVLPQWQQEFSFEIEDIDREHSCGSGCEFV